MLVEKIGYVDKLVNIEMFIDERVKDVYYGYIPRTFLQWLFRVKTNNKKVFYKQIYGVFGSLDENKILNETETENYVVSNETLLDEVYYVNFKPNIVYTFDNNKKAVKFFDSKSECSNMFMELKKSKKWFSYD